MVQGYPFPAPCPSWTTTPSWAALTEKIKSGATTAAERNAEFYKYIFHFLLDVAITNAFILQKGYCEDAPFSSIKEFRLKLASKLIGDYCSRRRAGRSGGVVHSLPLRHFPTTIPESDPSKKAKHKRACCTRCYSRSKRSMYTSWYCPQCQVWLCHTGEQSTDCYMSWHAQHVPEL